jgi:azurin
MKNCVLPLTLSAALLLVGCGKQTTAAPAPTAAAPAPAPAVAAAPAATPAATAAAARTIEVTANDQMKFGVTSIEAKPGETLKIVLKNTGTLPKEAMGHNWVLLKKGSDAAAFSNAAVAAKATDYIPDSLKGQVVAHTKLIGPKQTDEVTFTVPSEAGDYPFLCSFPAHFVVGMKGVLTVK